MFSYGLTPTPSLHNEQHCHEEEGPRHRQCLNREGRQQPRPEDAARTLAEADEVVR